jgi:hypothetical protein
MEAKKIQVFQYWGQGLDRMPEILKEIYNNNLKICKKFNINLILIDDINVYNYITPHRSFKKLAYNFKSDIIRYYVLHKYGGFWFDTDIIIIKDLNILYKNISKHNYECMLDVEFNTKIGCASLFIAKNSIVSNFCINYINNILDKDTELFWTDIGPMTVEQLYKKHHNLILLNDYNNVKNGCNFICWNDRPGINKKKWYFDNEQEAKEKAEQLINNKMCYYLITWTIYNKNDIKGNICDFVFKNNKSVFSYVIKN